MANEGTLSGLCREVGRAAVVVAEKKPMPAITRTRDHQYSFNDVVYPGVTGLIGVVDKSDALMGWAARGTAEAAIRLVDKLPELIETSGAEGVVKLLTARSGFQRDEAAKIGTQIHSMAEMIARGESLPFQPDGIRERVLRYADWWTGSGWSIRLAEAYLVNETLGYGGTLDLLARDEKGLTVLLDVKSGRGVYAISRLQMVAYGDAEWIAPPESPVAYPMPRIDRYVIAHVTDKGVRLVELAIDDIDRAAFAACLPLSTWFKDRGRNRL